MTTKPITIEIEHKNFSFEVKAIDADQGIIKGYLSVFNNIDSQNDRVRPGAFKKTIADAIQRKSHKGKKYLFPLLFMHDPEKPIGGFVDAIEDKTGLLVTAQLDVTTNDAGIPMNPLATSVFSGFKQGYIDELSIGYKALQKEYERGTGIRDLSEVQLFEGSAVTMLFASNDQAQVSSVKTTKGTPMEKPEIQKKDFSTYLQSALINNWLDGWYSLTSALKKSVMDAFGDGDKDSDIVTDIGDALNGSDGMPGFVQAVIDWANMGKSLGYTNTSDIYGYMARNDTLEQKAGAVVSQSNAQKLLAHAGTLRTVADEITHYVTGGPAYVEQGTDSGTQASMAMNTGKSKDVEPLEQALNDNVQPLMDTDIDLDALALQIKAALTGIVTFP